MKTILLQTALFLLLSAQVVGQIGFKNVEIQVPNTTTTLKAVEIGDVSNDGLNDVVTGSIYYGKMFPIQYIVVYLQKNDGTLATPITLNYTRNNETLYDIEIADVNNDKLNDIVLAFGSSIGIYHQLPTGGFGELQLLNGINASHGIQTGDLNDDGLVDILGFQNSSYKLFYQTQAGAFSLTSIPVRPTNYTQIQVGDLNGDGLMDIANNCNSGIEILYQKKGLGITKTDSLFIANRISESYSPSLDGFTLADINNDGRCDIATAYGGNTGRMKLFYQTAEGKIDTLHAKVYTTYDIPTPIRISDLNCDGDNEIIIGNNAWDHISIYNKHNQADYGGYTLYPSLYYFTPFSLAVGDINGDHQPDILDVDQDAKISILYNQSKPLTFNSYERKVNNLQIKRDTIIRDTAMYTVIPDTSTTCKRNNYRKFQIHQRWNKEQYSGDSLVIRHGFTCTEYTDTLKSAFAFTKRILLSTDTVQSIENRDSMSVGFGNMSVASEARSTYALICSNVCWNISIDQDWVKSLVIWTDNGDLEHRINSYVEFFISANPTIYARKATVTITGDGAPTRTYTIEQEGAEPVITSSASSLVLNEEVFNTAHLLVWSTINWEAKVDADWLSVDKMQGAPNASTPDELHEVLTIRATPNTTDTERKAVITLSGVPSVTKQVTVRQLKYGYSTLKSPVDEGFRLYPNPVKDQLTMETDHVTTDSHLQICDLRGIVLFETNQVAAKNVLDFSHFQKGVYLLKVTIGTEVKIQKVIKY